MALTLKIGTFDFTPFIRVTPGEGWDQAGQPLDPQFGEGAVGAGDPLVGVTENNREMVWPVHLTPTKTPDFADTKDGLHGLIQAVNRQLASPQLVEWRDQDATDSTFFDGVYGRFDPDFNFRRAGRLWVSGTIRLWAKPHGHSGTFMTRTTVLGSHAITRVPVGSVAGDAPADVLVNYTSATDLPSVGSAYLFGYCVGATGQHFFWPAGSINRGTPSGSDLTGATTAHGSQVLRTAVAQPIMANFSVPTPLAHERLRAIALMRVATFQSVATHYVAMIYGSVPLGPTQHLRHDTVTGFTALDLGVIPPQAHSASLTSPVIARILLGRPAGSAMVDLAGLLVLPEDRTRMAVVPNDSDTIIFTTREFLAGGPSGALFYGNGGVNQGHLPPRGAPAGMPPATQAVVTVFNLASPGPGNRPFTAVIGTREKFRYAR